MTGDDSTAFRIGDITAYPARNELWAGENAESVQPKVMAVLSYLSQQYPRVVSSEELIEHVWSGRVVTQSSYKSITFLRKAIAALVGDEVYIEHHSKKGYQLAKEPYALNDSHRPGATDSRLHSARPLLTKMAIVTLAVALVGVLITQYIRDNKASWIWERSHTTDFSNATSINFGSDHVKEISPHPDSESVAFITTVQDRQQVQIRRPDGSVWPIVQSDNEWSLLQWSPDGKSLAVVERDLTGGKGEPFFGVGASLATIHVFELDLDKRVLLDKHRLSDWYGEIFSISWWLDNTVEFVAQSGSNSAKYRYRYALNSQNLQKIAASDAVDQPLQSQIQQGFTALVSEIDSGFQLVLLDQLQRPFQRYIIEGTSVQISWMPDASGVLAVINENQLKLFYRDGRTKVIASPDNHHAITSARYSGDGERIVYIAANTESAIWLQADQHNQVLDAKGNIVEALIHPAGTDLIALRQYKGKSQIVQYPLTLGSAVAEDPAQVLYEHKGHGIRHLRWLVPGNSIGFAMNKAIYSLSVTSNLVHQLAQESGVSGVVQVDDSTGDVISLRRLSGTKNFWRYQENAKQWSQISFGDVASTVNTGRDAYYQYVDQPGAWSQRFPGQAKRLFTDLIPANSRLWAATDEYLYYTPGRRCRESGVTRIQLTSGEVSRLTEALPGTNTLAYSPQLGRIYAYCRDATTEVMALSADE